MATEGNSNDPELRLLRYLYVGKEYPNYQPGYWFDHHYFMVSNVPSIEELAENEEKQLVPIELITQAFEDNFITHPEALMFALAVCCRQDKSQELRHAAYKSVNKICVSTPNFILFVKFVSRLSRGKDLKFIAQGWGHGLRNAINSWYLSKEPLDFAKCVTRYRSRYGWKHRDIVKMAHPLGNCPENKMILKYIMHGMEKTKEDLVLNQLTENHNIMEILKYIEEVEDFKHCEDEVRAASLLELYGLSLDHVPAHLLKSKEVWNSLISSVDIVVLLNNLQRIHNLGFLATNEPAVTKVTDQLTNAENIVRSAVHPALIFIVLRDYQSSGKCLTYEKRKVRELAKKSLPPPSNPNVKIIDALNNAFYLSFNNLQSTNLRYLVTIGTNKAMLEGRTWQNGNMTGIETATLIAMLLLRSEDNVSIATFKNYGISIANVCKTNSFEHILEVLQAMPVTSTNPSRPIMWSKSELKQYDVFINIMDQVYHKYDESQENLISYREALELPQAKLISCGVCSSSPYHKAHYDRHILTINGFDATVPKVIQAFAQGLF